jgi:hypothetical protein
MVDFIPFNFMFILLYLLYRQFQNRRVNNQIKIHHNFLVFCVILIGSRLSQFYFNLCSVHFMLRLFRHKMISGK